MAGAIFSLHDGVTSEFLSCDSHMALRTQHLAWHVTDDAQMLAHILSTCPGSESKLVENASVNAMFVQQWCWSYATVTPCLPFLAMPKADARWCVQDDLKADCHSVCSAGALSHTEASASRAQTGAGAPSGSTRKQTTRMPIRLISLSSILSLLGFEDRDSFSCECTFLHGFLSLPSLRTHFTLVFPSCHRACLIGNVSAFLIHYYVTVAYVSHAYISFHYLPNAYPSTRLLRIHAVVFLRFYLTLSAHTFLLHSHCVNLMCGLNLFPDMYIHFHISLCMCAYHFISINPSIRSFCSAAPFFIRSCAFDF